MILKLMRLMGALGLIAMIAVLGGSALRADEPDQDDLRPPQVLPKGFESTDRLQRDLERAENAPLYSAWIVESSRFVDVPFGSFMPDRDFINASTPRHDIQFIDFPVNVGIIKGKDGKTIVSRSNYAEVGRGVFVITKANKQPDLTLRWVDQL